MNAISTSKIPNPKFQLRPPSQRDLEIYERARLSGHAQRQLADEYGIHHTRVSQIIRSVEAWLAAGGSPTDPQLKNARAQRRVTRSLQKLRLLRAVKLATAALDARPEPATKTRRRLVEGEEVWREESQANSAPINLYALQNYVLAVKALESFEQAAQEDADQEPIVPPETLQDIIALLRRFRSEAQAAGHVPFTIDVYGLVVTTLQYLLGPNICQHRTQPSEARAQLEQQLSALSENRPAATPRTPPSSGNSQSENPGGGGRGVERSTLVVEPLL